MDGTGQGLSFILLKPCDCLQLRFEHIDMKPRYSEAQHIHNSEAKPICRWI